MRIAIGQLMQETNTLNPWPTTRANFDQFDRLEGDELVEKLFDTNEPGGFIQSLRAWPEKPTIAGLSRFFAWPSGLATAETFAWIRDEFLRTLARALPVDGVLLALHGAMSALEHPDVEGDLLEALRGALGRRTPLVVTLDLHANITPKMVAHADALVLFHTAPHIDVFETGVRGAAVLRRILVDGARPTMSFCKLPLVVPAERANTQDPASVSFEFKNRIVEWEARTGVLTAGLAPVQPWLDIPELGTSVVVCTDGDRMLADSLATELAHEVWRRRREYLPELTPFADAIREAAANSAGLYVLSDSADATTSGAPGDSTWLLSEMLKYEWQRPAIVTLVAPELVELAAKTGPGGRVQAIVGGKLDHRFSKPIPFEGAVERLFDAKFMLSGHLAKNLPVDMGASAVLRRGNVIVVATSKSGPHFAPQLFLAAGLDPYAAQLLVAKSPCGFRAAYAPRAKKIMVAQAPGCAPSDFWKYDFREIPRPLWPWDEIEDPAPKVIVKESNDLRRHGEN